MVRSERFTGLISVIVGTDLEAVIGFLRSEGVNVSLSATPTQVVKVLVLSMKNSDVFRDNFANWADNRYTNKSNMSGESYASGGFDPMATQGSGQEFDAMSSQQGVNLKDGGFSNASGEFDTMATQSGGFSPINTQNGANLKEDRFSTFSGKNKTYEPYNPSAPVGTTGSKFGNFLRGDTLKDVLKIGVGWFQSDTEFKQQRALQEQGLEAERLRLEQLKLNKEITQQEFDARYQLAKQQSEAPQSTVIFWVIGGVVLLGALGTTIYFATRKK
tara:strand:+ start:2740 stop:3558 length:819 start_codon:yes stop_codon:yes gene_type:complete